MRPESIARYNAARFGRLSIPCEFCGEHFEVPLARSTARYCSYRCRWGGATSFADRLWLKVDKHGPVPAADPDLGPCWLWQGAITNRGYGHLQRSRPGTGTITAHRASWELHAGPVPRGLCVLHRCDVRRCVNPAHLFLGTKAANSLDMVEKQRHGGKRLTPEMVLEIRVASQQGGISGAELARRYGVSPGTVSHLLTGKTWKHIR